MDPLSHSRPPDSLSPESPPIVKPGPEAEEAWVRHSSSPRASAHPPASTADAAQASSRSRGLPWVADSQPRAGLWVSGPAGHWPPSAHRPWSEATAGATLCSSPSPASRCFQVPKANRNYMRPAPASHLRLGPDGSTARVSRESRVSGLQGLDHPMFPSSIQHLPAIVGLLQPLMSSSLEQQS